MDCQVVGRLVDNMHDHRVSLGDLYRRPRQLTVHHSHWYLVAHVRHVHLAHLLIINSTIACMPTIFFSNTSPENNNTTS